jgi:hypothetical protein
VFVEEMGYQQASGNASNACDFGLNQGANSQVTTAVGIGLKALIACVNWPAVVERPCFTMLSPAQR